MENLALVFVVEESNDSSFIINELSYNSKLEKRTIRFDFSSSTSMVSRREVSPQNDGCEPLESQNMSRLEDGSDSLSFPSQVQSGLQELSFSTVGCLLALISNPG